MSGVPTETSTDDVHAHPRHTGHSRFDVIMAVCAIFISAISLAVAVEHGRTERDLVAANSWPFLRAQISNNFDGGKALAIGLSNGGVGPAKIHTFEMFIDGHPVSSPTALLQLCCGLAHDDAGIRRMLPGGLEMSSVNETVLRPGEENDVLIVPRRGTDPQVATRLSNSLTHLRFRVCYCSVLDQCWTSDLLTTDTPPAGSCPRPKVPYHYNG